MQSVNVIPVFNLALSFIPAFVVVGIMSYWSLSGKTSVYAIARMLVQLIAIGYVLTYIFETNQSLIVVAVLIIMLLVSSWIALRPLSRTNSQLYFNVLIATSLGGVSTLFLVTTSVLELQPWFAPHMVIPLAGMIFSNAMNTVSVAAERFESETVNQVDYMKARNNAMRAAMIPVINSMFAVGLVSLPGMMTGQILSGVSPLIAVRYQIMVMCMIFGSSGISAACYLWLMRKHKLEEAEPQSQ